jgi:hypothetical protein
MKRYVILLSALVMAFIMNSFVSFAQEELIEEENQKKEQPNEQVKPDQPKEEILDEGDRKKSLKELYYKEKYEETFQYSFEIVWNAIKEALKEVNCLPAQEKYQQTDAGLYKGNLKSDYCVIATGKDSTFDALKRYSLEMPYIRGGIWLNARMLYKFKLTEKDDGSVDMVMTGEISGFEDFVTHEVHFWKSNGILETEMLKKLKKHCDLLKTGQ